LEQNAAHVLREMTISQDEILTNLIMCAVILGEGLTKFEILGTIQPPLLLIVPVFPEGHLNE
jgi:hypothetical protein